MKRFKGCNTLLEMVHDEMSRRAAAGRARLRALTPGGAVWDAFRENANCGDPAW